MEYSTNLWNTFLLSIYNIMYQLDMRSVAIGDRIKKAKFYDEVSFTCELPIHLVLNRI